MTTNIKASAINLKSVRQFNEMKNIWKIDETKEI